MEGNHRMRKIRLLYHSNDNIQTSSLIENFLDALIEDKRVEIIYMTYVDDEDEDKQLYSMFFQFDYPKSTDSIRTLLKEIGLNPDKASFGKLIGLKEKLFDSYIRYTISEKGVPYIYYNEKLREKYKNCISTL